jgi:ankyrin repeat protein
LINRPTPKPTSALDNLALVRMMLERGADPNARLTLPVLPRFHNAGDAQLGEGATPLMRAAKRRDLPVMRLLLDHGADPNLSTKSYATPLLFAAGLGSRGGDETEQAIEALRLCLDRGADIHAFNDAGLTALHIAVERGDDLVRFLAERGADLDLQDKAGRTPLDVALGVSAAAFEGRRRAGPGVVRESTAALLRELGATSAADAEAPR